MPVKGRIKGQLTIQNVLKKIADYDIYRYYIGHDFVQGKAFHSPLRTDNNPSFTITIVNNKLKHMDYGDNSIKGDCLDFVCQLFKVTPSQALLKIDNDFGLGISSSSTNTGEYKAIIAEHKPISKTVSHSKITVVSRRFDTAELAYWKLYHITEKMLISNDVYAIKRLYLNGRRYPLRNDLCFGYLFGDKWKIYWPERKKSEKWAVNNVPNDLISGIEKIKAGDKWVIVTKSKKDQMVLSLFLPKVISVQSEGIHTINDENLKLLQSCPNTVICFDSDETGINASKYFNQFGFKWINCPKGYKTNKGLNIKDFADLARYYGLDLVKAYFRSKHIPF
jgi:hypothetical protein